MMFFDFQTTTHGKWILAGEHAVIRGHGALVFPILGKELTLSYNKSIRELNATYEGESGSDTHLLFWSVLEQGTQILGRSLNSLSGHFNLYCSIPIGVGMGASAALCVATARWFSDQGMLADHNIPSFARELENLFHGQSSGLDIAGVAATSGVYFKQGLCSPLELTWQPKWFLSSCEQIGITSHCIRQVDTLWQEQPNYAEKIDQKMADCVLNAREALVNDAHSSTASLAKAMNDAADCFQQWGLISESLQKHMQQLKESGAVAVKPTGSGGGGYVVSLWETDPPEMSVELIAV